MSVRASAAATSGNTPPNVATAITTTNATKTRRPTITYSHHRLLGRHPTRSGSTSTPQTPWERARQYRRWTNTSRLAVSPETRLLAADSNATNRPSPLIEGPELWALASLPRL